MLSARRSNGPRGRHGGGRGGWRTRRRVRRCGTRGRGRRRDGRSPPRDKPVGHVWREFCFSRHRNVAKHFAQCQEKRNIPCPAKSSVPCACVDDAASRWTRENMRLACGSAWDDWPARVASVVFSERGTWYSLGVVVGLQQDWRPQDGQTMPIPTFCHAVGGWRCTQSARGQTGAFPRLCVAAGLLAMPLPPSLPTPPPSLPPLPLPPPPPPPLPRPSGGRTAY